MAAAPCTDCSLYAQEIQTIVLQGDLTDYVNSKEKLKEFYRKVNSLVNVKGGLLVIHAENPRQLEKFDQKVDTKLCGLISCGALYHHVFQRSLFNPTHVVYKIKPAKRFRPFGAVDINSKIPHNKGLETPSYPQIDLLVDLFCKKPPNVGAHDKETCHLQFVQGEEVTIQTATHDEPFQERVDMQAKSAPKSRRPNLGDREANAPPYSTEDLIVYCWGHLKKYISAFTKIEGGGSVYFGVYEFKTKSELWTPADKVDFVCITETGKPQGWELWQDKQTEGVLYVAKAGDIKEKEDKTGEFKVEAVFLPEAEHAKFQRAILDKVVDELMWVGASEPQNPVEVHFHNVDKAPGDHNHYCVIEIKINYYHGFCFHHAEGPEVYECKFQKPGVLCADPVRVTVLKWFKSFKPDADQHMKELSWREKVSREMLMV